jgi:hypothetical protein
VLWDYPPEGLACAIRNSANQVQAVSSDQDQEELQMAFVFRRRLALPLWGIVFLTIALTPSPPGSRILMVAVGIAVIAFVLRGLSRQWRPSPLVVPAVSTRQRHRTTAALSMDGGTSVRTLDELNTKPADEALDLVRVDEDGSWQMPRPRLVVPLPTDRR